ncbi:MAG TPA: hypothetical protein DCG75_07675 [Bacteroidales bacterium]|nr:hypothetical protein [Bacteroidales bacterium]
MNKQNQYKFTEGEIHQFNITGFTEIPGTNESFYILENPFGGKHLLKAIHYKHYNLGVNQIINCTIDKINCSGKIYLEPENPIYKVGEIYSFDFIKIVDQINSVGEKEKAVLVKDQFGMEISCSLPAGFILKESKQLKCKVLRIKKGVLFLSIPETDLKENSLEIGKKYCFKVAEIKKLEKNINYYILKDEHESSYALKKDMYEHYEFKIGQGVECTVTKYNTDGHLKIEPVHPHYQIGKSYRFKYIRTEEEKNPLGNKEFVVLVKDIYGIETKVRSNLTELKTDFPDYISCKVDGIRKGKAILSLVLN